MAHASFGVRLEGDRSSIIHSVQAGSTIEDSIVIENPDDIGRDVYVFSVDQFQLADGRYELEGNYQKDSIFGTWIGAPVTLAVGARAVYKYSFKIIVPRDALNGIYHGALIMGEDEKNKIKEDGAIQITSQVGIRISITVSGGKGEISQSSLQQGVNRIDPELVTPASPPSIQLPASSEKIDSKNTVTETTPAAISQQSLSVPESFLPPPSGFIASAPLVAQEVLPSGAVPQVSQEYMNNSPQSAVYSSAPEEKVLMVEEQSGRSIVPIVILIAFVVGLFWMMIRLR